VNRSARLPLTVGRTRWQVALSVRSQTLFGYGTWWNFVSTGSRLLPGVFKSRRTGNRYEARPAMAMWQRRHRNGDTVANIQAGWHDDGSGKHRWWDGQKWTDQFQSPQPSEGGRGGIVSRIEAAAVSGAQPRPAANGASYAVRQVILQEKLCGTGSGNLTELERAVNAQAAMEYRLHTYTTAASGSKGIGGGDRIRATMVSERLT
jgi:hypothetical protein